MTGEYAPPSPEIAAEDERMTRFRFDLPPQHNIEISPGDHTDERRRAEEMEKRLENVGLYHNVRQDQVGSATIRLIHDRLDAERRVAYLRLGVCDPENPKRVRELQNVIARANQFEDWISAFLKWGQEQVDEIRREMGGEQRTD